MEKYVKILDSRFRGNDGEKGGNDGEKGMGLLDGQMLDLNKKLALAGTPHEKELLSRRIGHTDSQIDALVYDLYALTPEEIEIVEGKG